MTAPEPARRPAPRSRGGDPAPGADVDRGRPGEPHPLAALQEAFGNLGVVRRLADPAVQAKLDIGAPDDDYEREADRVAASIMRRPEPVAGAAEAQVQRRAEDDDKRKTTPPPQRAPGAAQKAPPPPPPAPKPAQAPTPTTLTPPPRPAAAPKKPEATKKEPPKQPQQPPGGPGKKREDETVARKPSSAGSPALTRAAASTIQSQQGAGRPLPPAERGFFESRFGRDLSAVRVHDDAAARNAARDISAQAFTYGQDIYFGAGRYQPGTESGRELIAHELAHTVQQRPGARLERRVQRQPTRRGSGGGGGSSRPSAATTSAPSDTTTGDAPARPASPLQLGELAVPGFRLRGPEAHRYTSPANPPLQRSQNYTGSRAATDESGAARARPQRELWAEAMQRSAALNRAVRGKLIAWRARNHAADAPQAGAADQLVVRSSATAQGRYMIGTLADVSGQLSLPDWDRTGASSVGRERGFQVDHILELQLTGFPEHTEGHDISNFQLLRGSVNQASGPAIDDAIDDAIVRYLRTLPQEVLNDRTLNLRARSSAPTAPVSKEDAHVVKQHYLLQFSSVTGTRQPRSIQADDVWSKDEIERGDHLDKQHGGRPVVEFTSMAELGGHGSVVVLPSGSGGHARRLSTRTAPQGNEAESWKPFVLESKSFNVGRDWADHDELGTLNLVIPRGHKTFRPGPAPITLTRFPGAQYAGHLGGRGGRGAGAAVSEQLTGLNLRRASPVVVEQADLDAHGFVIQGHVVTDLPLLQGVTFDFAVRGDDLELSKTFTATDFHVPPPLHIDTTTMTLGVRTSGELFVRGEIDASIDRVGSGYLRGAASTEEGFELEGGFDARSDLFNPAHIDLAYRQGHFSGHGIIGIGAGKVPGVKHAQLEARYEEGHFSAQGNADFDIPGVRSGEVHLDYDSQHGLTIGGTLTLGAIPGIREGTISATISERPDGSGYKLAAQGSATAAIPGFEVQLVIDYDDGAFLAQATLPVHRGLIEGEITLGATNRPTDENNRPIPGAPPLPAVSIFGSGTASMQITPWLRGTATVKLLANGELEVDGTLTVPGVNLWPEVAPEPTTLVHPPDLEFPIFGPVVLTLGGHLDLKYGLSAGVLSGSLSVHYNPAHEDQTHLHGAIHLHASAFAGLELDVDVGIALDALVGSIGGSIELGAEVRADASVDPDIQIDWMPSAGFVIDPVFDAAVTPRLLFHIRARVTASLAFWSKTWTKDLADYAFGSGLALSVHLPAHYDEAHGFSVDWNKLEFHHPDIHPLDMAKDFLEELV
ncbi:MAG TPA: DUF4157 domain-containing protein [Gaiellaceae bacterium]|nr:DUF4157 domain-containing protein [Gaiellaceae bacterium]